MKKEAITVGSSYIARVSGRLTTIRIERVSSYGNGWEALNLNTGRTIHIRSARRLQRLVYQAVPDAQ